jgi:hypothetical protein
MPVPLMAPRHISAIRFLQARTVPASGSAANAKRRFDASGLTTIDTFLLTHLRGDHVGYLPPDGPLSSDGTYRLPGVSDVAAVVAMSMFPYSDMTLDVNSAHYVWNRVLQGLGYGLFLVPVNLIAYSQLRPDQNNKASSPTNLFRNWGGSFGIAFITTATERRENLHRSVLGSALGSASQAIQQRTHSLVLQLMHYGFTRADAGSPSLGIVYEQLPRQSLFLSFMDCFRVVAWLNILALPLAFAAREFKAAGDAPAGH